jgi:arsenical-resistance protein 2
LIKKVIFYCGKFFKIATSRAKLMGVGSCGGRGPRAASWFQDYIDDIAQFGRRSDLKVFILEGGIKKWVKEFEGSMVEGFDERYWKQFQ